MDDEFASPERLAKWSDAFREYSRDTDPTRSLTNLTRVWRELSGRAGTIAISTKNLDPGQYRINRVLHKEGVADHVPTTPLHAPDNPIHTGGIVGEIIASEEPKVLRDLRVTDDPVLGKQLNAYTQILAFPIFEDGEVTSWLLNFLSDEDVSGSEIENRFIQATLVGNVTDEKRLLKELQEARAWIEGEVDEIAQIQKKLLPAHMPKTDRIDWATFYETYERAGGDYYDVFPLSGDDTSASRWGVLIADAAGHGPSAAVVIAMISALRRSFPGTPRRPGELLEFLNRQLKESSIGYSFVTAHLAFIDAETLSVGYACAGHPPPLLKGPGGNAAPLETECSLPLGIEASTTYEDSELQLKPGETLLLYTDGITEARAPSGELMGDEELLRAFAHTTGGAEETLAQLVQRVRDHEAGIRPTDDQTMLVVQIRE